MPPTTWQRWVGKKLLRRIERCRRYVVDPPAIGIGAYLLLREKIIKPRLAGIVRPQGDQDTAPLWMNTTSHCAGNSVEPFNGNN